MSKTEADVIEEWTRHVNEEVRQKKAEQAFVNEMIDCVYKIGAFDGCPDEMKLYEVVRLAVRLAHSCHKENGEPPVRGFGVKGDFIRAARECTREADLKEIRADINRREQIKKLRKENKALKQRNAELEA